MLRELMRQFVNICDKAGDGFIVLVGNTEHYMNATARELFDDKVPAAIQNDNRSSIDSIHISEQIYDVRKIVVDDTTFVFVHKQSDDENTIKNMVFKAKVIVAISEYKKNAYSNAYLALEHMKVGDERYMRIIKTTLDSAVNIDNAICGIANSMCNKSQRITNCNIIAMLENVETNTNITLDTTKVKLAGLPTNLIAQCESFALETAVYSVISAFSHINRAEYVEISVLRANDQTMIVLKGKNIVWADEHKDFVYGRREDNLLEDIYKYGYELLYANSLMERQKGELFIKTEQDSTSVILTLPKEKEVEDLLIMQNKTEKYADIKTAEAALSEAIIRNAK